MLKSGKAGNVRLIFSILMLLLMLSSAASCYAQVVTHAYGNLPAQTLSVCLPSGQAKEAKERPGVLLIHGGAWIGGDKSGLLARCEAFAKNGIVSVTINYRLADSSNPSTRWPAQLDDASAALQWMIDHSRELGLNPGRICVYGESAGGHIALWLGIKDKRVAGVIDAFGPTDLCSFHKRRSRWIFDALVGNGSNSDNLRAASPLWYVCSDLSPTLIIQGEGDELVSPYHSNALYDAMKSKGVPVTMIKYQGGHSWAGLKPNSLDSIMAQTISFIKTAPIR
jgi:acetyl esterase/lipase